MHFFTKSNSEHLSQGRVGGGSGSGLGEKIRMTFYRKRKKTKNKKKKQLFNLTTPAVELKESARARPEVSLDNDGKKK